MRTNTYRMTILLSLLMLFVVQAQAQSGSSVDITIPFDFYDVKMVRAQLRISSSADRTKNRNCAKTLEQENRGDVSPVWVEVAAMAKR